MYFIVQKNALRKLITNIFNIFLIMTKNNSKQITIKSKSESKKLTRIKRLEKQLKLNILKRKIAKKNNG